VEKTSSSESPLVIVGVGASAGGLEAFSELLAALPAKPELAIVFVQHLAPTYESALLELLEKKTPMPVLEAKNGEHLKSNHVYIITPGVSIEVEDGAYIVSKVRKQEGAFHPVDILFRSLAKEYEHRAIGVVLSGTATDGTEGLLAIKEAGGITFAQDESAKHTGMPQSAIEASAVDRVLSPKEISKELLNIVLHPRADALGPAARLSTSGNGIQQILYFIQNRFGVDFTNYKQSMVERRIERRMTLARQHTLSAYLIYLKDKDTKGEDQALYQDLLINVTSFFRNPELFATLAHDVVPALLKGRLSGDALRIWVPGCSTGEEVYSIAIMITEILESMRVKPPRFDIKIFGTDASEPSIEKARAAMYPKGTLQRMSRDRLARFFIPINGSYQVHKSLREMCIFSAHNLLKDPPFSRMDLVSCQNLLIYLDTTLQKKAIRTFHYALKSTGYLVLGKSETVGTEGNMFRPVGQKHKIYTKKPGSVTARLVTEERTHPVSSDKKPRDVPEKIASIENEADEILLAHYTPASMVINSDMEIVRFRGATSSYLQPSGGSASLNLLKMVREELVLDLRSLLHTAKKEGLLAKKEGIPMGKNGSTHLTTIEVVPLRHPLPASYFMVLFSETIPAPLEHSDTGTKGGKNNPREKYITGLLRDLTLHKEQMRSMAEEYEAANEELQSANEEVLSSNEELQSINEELGTSQEELESTNEELTTINDELGIRNREISDARDFSEAIIATIREPLIVLNEDLKVQKANESFYKQFRTMKSDVEGHFFYDLGNGQWDIPDLRKLLNEVLTKNKVVHDFEIAHEFPSIGKKIVILNARTMVKMGGKESLILLAIEDITERRHSEDASRISEIRYRRLFETAKDGIFILDADTAKISDSNPFISELLGFSQTELLGKELWEVGFYSDKEANKVAVEKLQKTGYIRYDDLPLKTKSGQQIDVEFVSSMYRENGHQVIQCNIRDITLRKVGETKLEELGRSKDEFISMASHELRTPVTSIKGYAQLLESRFTETGDTASAEVVSKLDKQVDKLAALIADLFDNTKVKEGKLELNQAYFDFNALVLDAIEEVQHTTVRHTITSTLGKIPEIYGDSARLRQVVINLLTNAVKYSPEATRVEVATGADENFLTLSVHDFGIGVSKEDLSRIFTRFYRVRERDLNTYPGLGLGLYIASDIVRRHGGNLGVKSTAGHGSVFTMILPLHKK